MKHVSTAEKWAWILVASAAPAAHFLSGTTWYLVPAGTLVAWLFWAYSPPAQGKILSLLGVAAAGLMLCRSVSCMTDGWQDFGAGPVMPLTILALAVWACWRQDGRSRRVCCTLFWLVTPLLAVVLAAGIKEIHWDRFMRPEIRWDADGIWVLLLPCLWAGEEHGRRWKGWALGLTILCTALAAVTWGCLGPEGSFYDLAGSLNLFGVVQRFEPVVAAALTMGWFCFACYLMTAAAERWKACFPKTPAGIIPLVLAAAAAVVLPLNLSVSSWLVSVTSGILALGTLLCRKKQKEKDF